MKIIVGLGNPGLKYIMNRHNIGFLAVDALAQAYDFRPFKAAQQGQISEGKIRGESVILFKPLSFMNLSGGPVASLMRFFQLPINDLIVAHDDLDLNPGEVQAIQGGETKLHNGLKSLDLNLSPKYTRLKLGIGQPADRYMYNEYVLENFSSDDEKWLIPLLEGLTKHIPQVLVGELDTFSKDINETLSKG